MSDKSDKLSPRELELLGMAAKGLTTEAMILELEAQHLKRGASDSTIKAHFRSIFDKLGAVSRANAVAIAITRGELKFKEKGDDSE